MLHPMNVLRTRLTTVQSPDSNDPKRSQRQRIPRSFVIGLFELALLVLIASWPGLLLTAPPAKPAGPAEGKEPVPDVRLAGIPLHFEPNVGQADPGVRFMAHATGGNLFFTPSGVVLSLAGASTA